MTKKRGGCVSGCLTFVLWAVVVVLLVNSWEGSSWPLRGIELALLVVLGVVALAVRRREGMSGDCGGAPLRPGPLPEEELQ